MKVKSPVWRGHIQLSTSPPKLPIDRGGAYTSRISRNAFELKEIILITGIERPDNTSPVRSLGFHFSHQFLSE